MTPLRVRVGGVGWVGAPLICVAHPVSLAALRDPAALGKRARPGEEKEERAGREKRTRECDGTISRRAAGGASDIQVCGSTSGMQRVRTREHE